ncbi:hypothetical protein, conserved [Eimeria praecox]|uniref:Uncharacterized protein n=1 Tax=Eimeria praecox TaxID=51316 RepID=U6GQV9_9EIME|nr:hypothetical protein, conserved [Eimeria praecox]
MSNKASADPSKSTELLMGISGTGGKEVYEYTPDPGSLLVHDSSSQEGFDRDTYRLTRGAKEIDESEVSPSTAYEFFRGKTYKSSAFRNGFFSCEGCDASDSGPLEVRGQRTLHGAFKRSRAAEKASAEAATSDYLSSSFETPIGRLKRLQGEVEEMLEFVSSFLVEERVPASDRSEVQSAIQLGTTSGEPTDDSNATKHPGTHNVRYHARRLPPAAQEALLFGHDPLSLIEELKRLRMQQHLAAASAQLRRTLASEGREATSSSSSASPQNALAPSSATTEMSGGTDVRKRDEGGKAGLTTAYEVYCVPSLSPMIEQSRITSLERRLAFVENKMGLHKMSLLPHADLFEAVAEMQERMKLLDQQKIESLQKRVQARQART